MHKKIRFIVISTLLLFQVVAGSSQPVKTTKVSANTARDAQMDSLATTIKAILTIQDSTYQQRMRAIDARKNGQKDHERSEFGVMSEVEKNTRKSFWGNGWNILALLAFLVSGGSFVVALRTYNEQKKTEKNTKKSEENTKKAEQNTKRVSLEAQRYLLNDILRHLYRNYVITYTMKTKVKDANCMAYPSEEHFEKLKIPMENIHLDVFNGEDASKLQLMHVLYLNLRNYNAEVDVVMKHISSPTIPNETKDEDFETLEFKVSFLTDKIISTIYAIWGDEPERKKELKKEMREALQLSLSGRTNAKQNVDVESSGEFPPLTFDRIKESAYSKLYSQKELQKFCLTFNNDVREERKKNQRGAWKVRMIRFDSADGVAQMPKNA